MVVIIEHERTQQGFRTLNTLFHLDLAYGIMIREHPSKTSAFLGGRGQKFAKFTDGMGIWVKNRENLPTS